MANVDRKSFAISFEPVVQIEENLHLMPLNKYFKVSYIEGIPLLEHDFGDFTAGETKSDQEVTEVYLEDDEIGQYRFVPITAGVHIVGLKQPKGRPKWVTKTARAKLTNIRDYADTLVETLQLTEVYQYKDTGFSVDVYSTNAVSAAIVRFYGIRFKLVEIKKPEVFKTIWTEGR